MFAAPKESNATVAIENGRPWPPNADGAFIEPPAIGNIGFVGRHKTFGHDDFAIFQTRTNGVAYPVEWGKFALGKGANAFYNRVHHIGCGIGEAFMLR
jgi:hypothetical protein